MKIAVLSDIHEDFESLKRAFIKVQKKNCDKIVCLGDISGFSVPNHHFYHTRNAHKCLEMIIEHCEIIVAGNHDLNAAKRIPMISPGFRYPENWFDLDYYEKLEMSKEQVWIYDQEELNPLYKKQDIEFLKSLPEYEILQTEKYNILFSHYIYPNLTGSSRTFYRRATDFSEHLEYMKEKNCMISLCGHAHIPESMIVYENSVSRKKYRKLVLKAETVCIIAPPIIQPNIGGRFLTLDTVSLELENIKI